MPVPLRSSPIWKSTFAKRAVSPSGKTYVVCCGLYNIKMEDIFIVNAVNAAAILIEKIGRSAFPVLRDPKEQFIFLDTYVFVDTPEGIELVNSAFPNLEGRNLLDIRVAMQKYIPVALNKDSGWVDYQWPKPGKVAFTKKHIYVKKVQHGQETFIVGSGAYLN